MVKKPLIIPVPIDIEEEEDCPKCPPVGAPAWMATFADMATLLMAFFVLILSFAELNVPKFKTVAGSLREAFGIQRLVPSVEQPRGTTVLSLDFSPSPSPALTNEMTQQSTETESPELPTDDSGQSAGEAEDERETPETPPPNPVQEAIKNALAEGNVTTEVTESGVTVQIEMPTTAQELLQQTAQDEAQQPDQETIAETLAALIDAAGQGDAEGLGTAERKAALAEAELRVALRREVSEGLVTVEQVEDRVILTVGAGGAFPSGTADLTEEARDVMARIAFSAMNDASRIEVTGHTDTVPLNPNSPYRDNWGLGAARAASVVREFANSGLIEPNRLLAMSNGETAPVASNADAAGRERNRRIEIEISY